MRTRAGAPARIFLRAVTAAALGLGFGGAAKAPSGVTPTEIVVGTHLDLTGPLSELGTAVRNGIEIAFDDVNAKGGIFGRKLRLIADDDGYSVRRAASVTKTLLFRDHIFAMLCPTGTLEVAKTMPLVLGNGTLHLFPFAAVDQHPTHPLAFAIDLPVARQIAIGLHEILAERGALKVGVLYRSDPLGATVLKGTSDGLGGERTVAVAAYAPGENNFVAQLASLRQSGAELIVLGGTAQEAIVAMQQAAAQQWLPVFLCSAACYVPELPTLGGRVVAGLYAVAATPIPYPDDKDVALRAWVRRYERRFGTVASQQAFRAYLNARVFAEALRRAGPDPTARRVASALERMSPWRDPDYGGIPIVFTPRDHIGLHDGFLAQVRSGRWTTLARAWPLASHP